MEKMTAEQEKQFLATHFGEPGEQLNEELKLWLGTTQWGKGPVQILRHPLVFGVPYMEQMNGYYNRSLYVKQQALDEALGKNDFHSYIFLHERPYRINAFQTIKVKMTDAEYWEMLGDIWCDSENIWQNQKEWRELLHSDRPGREHFMSEEDRKEFDALPERVPIYRGYQMNRNKNGISWTLDKKKAEWFSKRLTRPGEAHLCKVAVKTAKKSDLFALTNRRDEHEIIYLKKGRR